MLAVSLPRPPSAVSISRQAACLIDVLLELSGDSSDGDLLVRHSDRLHT